MHDLHSGMVILLLGGFLVQNVFYDSSSGCNDDDDAYVCVFLFEASVLLVVFVFVFEASVLLFVLL